MDSEQQHGDDWPARYQHAREVTPHLEPGGAEKFWYVTACICTLGAVWLRKVILKRAMTEVMNDWALATEMARTRPQQQPQR